jgi:predicted  nucleic acid-binding Zn-ribbon protein
MAIRHKCLQCGRTFMRGTQKMGCAACGTHWPACGGVPFYDSAYYFGENTKDKIRQFIA